MEGLDIDTIITKKELSIFHQLIVISSILIGMASGFLISSIIVSYPESRTFSLLFGFIFIPGIIIQFLAIGRNTKYGEKYRHLKRSLK